MAITIVGISGSVREGSFNAALLRAAASFAPEGVTFDIRSIRDVPLYDGDVEARSGVPEPVRVLKDAVAAAQGVVLASPEYNGSIPGVMKNAVDWMSRPADDIARVFGNRPVVLMGATPGPAGTRLAQTAWLPVLRQLGMLPWFGKTLYVAGAGKAFDAELNLVDEGARKQLKALVEGFAAFCGAAR